MLWFNIKMYHINGLKGKSQKISTMDVGKAIILWNGALLPWDSPFLLQLVHCLDF